MWLNEPNVLVGSDIVQVNIYGATLNEMLHKGVNLAHLLRGFGYENCVVFDVPRQSAVTDRFRGALMIDESDARDVSEEILVPPVGVKEELDAETIVEGRVVCSTPLHADHPLMNCSLSTIHSLVDDGMLESGGGFVDDEEFEEEAGLNREYVAPAANDPESSYEDTFVAEPSPRAVGPSPPAVGPSPRVVGPSKYVHHTFLCSSPDISLTDSVMDVMLYILDNVPEKSHHEAVQEDTLVAPESEELFEEPAPDAPPEAFRKDPIAIEQEIFEREEEVPMGHPLDTQDAEMRAVLGEFFEFPQPLLTESAMDEEADDATIEAPRNRRFESVPHNLSRSCSLVVPAAASRSEEQRLPAVATSISHRGWLNSVDFLLKKVPEDKVSERQISVNNTVDEDAADAVESTEEETVFPFVSPEGLNPSASSSAADMGDFEMPGTSVCGEDPPPESPAPNLPFESPCSSSTLKEIFGDLGDDDDEFFDCSRGDTTAYEDVVHDGGDFECSDAAGDGPNVSTEKMDQIDRGVESDVQPPPKKRRKQKANDGIPAKDYICQFPQCGMKIKWKPGYGRNRLLRHVTGVHSSTKPWKCRICGHRTSSEHYVSGQMGTTMTYHHRSKHPDVPYVKAENCETQDDVKALLSLWKKCFPEVPPPRSALSNTV